MNRKPAWVTQVVVTFIGFALMLMACATAPVSSPRPWPASPSPDLLAQGANIEATRAAGQAQADAASTQIALANAQGTQVAAQLTATPAAATQAWQATEHALVVQQTEQAIARFNADATATASNAQTADAFVLIVRVQDIVKCFISKKAQDIVNYFLATIFKSDLSHALSQKETAWTRNRNFAYGARRCVCACKAFRIASFSKRSTAAQVG